MYSIDSFWTESKVRNPTTQLHTAFHRQTKETKDVYITSLQTNSKEHSLFAEMISNYWFT